MRFAISLLALRPGAIGGTENYLRALVAALPSCLAGDSAFALLARDVADALPTPGLDRVVVDVSTRSLTARRAAEALLRWRDRRLERVLAQEKPDAVFFPQFSMFPRVPGVPAVVHVADVQHLLHPRHFAVADRLFRRAIYPYSLARADLVVAVSQFTARTLVEVAAVSAAKIRVVRHGRFVPVAEPGPLPAGVRSPYLYFPAVTEGAKDHASLFARFAELAGESRAYQLVLSGRRTARWKDLWRRAGELGIADRVIHVGRVDDEAVASLYRSATALVFPSTFEGFGLPLVEAAAFALPILASDLPVFRENDVEGIRFVDFTRPGALAEALRDLEPTHLRADAWTWEDAARGTLAALAEAANRRCRVSP